MSRLLRGPGRVVRAALDDLVTTFYPTDCRACGGPLLRAGLSPVCDHCIDGVRRQSMTLCGRCGEALDMEGVRFAGQFPVEGLLCSPCRMVPPEFERAVAYAVYQDELREMVHLLKYERMRAVAKPLGRMLARAIETLEAEAGRELLVVAVPLFPSKERERGYNQAVLLADAALAELKRSRPEWKLQAAHGVIRRVKDTRSQFELTPKGRRRNLQGAFAVADGSSWLGARFCWWMTFIRLARRRGLVRGCCGGLGRVRFGWRRCRGRSRRWLRRGTRRRETAVWDAG